MKKILAIIAAVGFLSLGFTLTNKTPNPTVVKSQNSEIMDFSHKLDEKRLARWD